MKKIFRMTFIVMILVMGLLVLGCRTVEPTATTLRTNWAEYTDLPNKDYTVVGAVIVRSSSILTLNADLMERAVALGAHDIMNVRIDIQRGSDGITRVVAGSAVAIRYTDQIYYPDVRINITDSVSMAETFSLNDSVTGRVWFNPSTWFRSGE